MTKRRAGWVLMAAGACALALVGALGWRHHRHRRARAVSGERAKAGPLIAGRILDRQGRPIAGARITLAPDGSPDGGAGAGQASALTDAKGRFSLVAGAGRFRLEVAATGFVAEELRAITAPSEGIEVELGRRLALEGVVRADGRPQAGAELLLGGADGIRKARSGPDGSFAFEDVAEGLHALRATYQQDQAAYLDGVSVGPAATDGGVPLLAVELHPALVLSGQLRDRAGGPIAGGEVVLEESALAPLGRTVKSGPDGEFRFAAVLPGSYLVSARAPGYLVSEPLTVRVPDRAPLALELERGATVRGQVVDEDGQPVQGARLEVSGEGAGGAPIAVSVELSPGPGAARVEPSGELGILRGPIPYPPLVPLPLAPGLAAPASAKAFVTDAHGAFELIGLPPGRLVVAAQHPDFARAASEPISVKTGQSATVQIVLRRGALVSGRVVDSGGLPLVGAELLGDGLTLAVSGRDGEFRIPHVAGPLAVTARLPGYLPATRTLAPGDETPAELTLARAEGRLSGVVVDDRGTPLPAARLSVSAPPLPPRTTLTGPDGRFHLDGLPLGPYQVRVTLKDFAPGLFSGIEPTDDARFDLELGAGLSGEVRDARTGETPRGLKIEVSSDAGERAVEVAEGRFTALGLPAGRVRLSVSAPGYVAWWRELSLDPASRPGEVTAADLDVELERGGTVLGTVEDPNGDPAAGALVRVGELSARTDRDGRFHIEGVQPGRYLVRAQAAGAAGSAEADVREGDEVELDLELR